jgi:hypothetical protein
MKLTLALAIIIATSSAAWAQNPYPAPPSSFKMPSYQLPPPQQQNWDSTQHLGYNPNPSVQDQYYQQRLNQIWQQQNNAATGGNR